MEVERAAVAALNRRKPGHALHANIEMDAGLLLEAVGVPRDALPRFSPLPAARVGSRTRWSSAIPVV